MVERFLRVVVNDVTGLAPPRRWAAVARIHGRSAVRERHPQMVLPIRIRYEGDPRRL
jgi:hypothetical protein